MKKEKINRILKTIETQDELTKKLQDKSFETFEKLTEKEQDSFSYYTADGYFDLNDYLKGKYYDFPNGEEIVNNLNNSMDKFKFNKDFTVWSVTSKSHYAKYKKGDIINLNRFISLSTSQEVVGVFAGNENDGLFLKINRKQNSKGMFIGISSVMFTEREFLFSNTQSYRIIGRSTKQIIGKTFEVLEVETV